MGFLIFLHTQNFCFFTPKFLLFFTPKFLLFLHQKFWILENSFLKKNGVKKVSGRANFFVHLRYKNELEHTFSVWNFGTIFVLIFWNIFLRKNRKIPPRIPVTIFVALQSNLGQFCPTKKVVQKSVKNDLTQQVQHALINAVQFCKDKHSIIWPQLTYF